MATGSTSPTSSDDLLEAGLKESRENSPGSEYRAIALFEQFLRTESADHQKRSLAYQHLGCSYYKLGNYLAAIGAFENGIIENRRNIFARIQKGRALVKTHQFGTARIVFQEIRDELRAIDDIQQKKGSNTSLRLFLDTLHQIAIIVSKSGNDEEAIEYFDEAGRFYDDYNRSDTGTDEEKKAAEKCLDTLYNIRISKCFSLNKLGRGEEAREQLNTVIRELRSFGDEKKWRKNLVSAYIVLGTVYLDNYPSDPAALATLDTAINLVDQLDDWLKPRYIWRVYRNKGLFLKKQKEFDEAIKCFTKGITEFNKVQPGNIESHLVYERGLTYTEMQKFEEGIKDLRLLQQFDPRYALIDIALAEAYHKKAMYNLELEFQQKLLEKFTPTVKDTIANLQGLSDEIRESLKNVEHLFYILFGIGMIVFLLALVWTFMNQLSGQVNPMIPVISIIGGIDVILSMMLFSPTKIQKNRIDYSQWLMGYYNWLNTEFVAGVIISERLMKIHAPTNKEETLDWSFAESMHRFLHTMTKEMMETIDKCCEFPDVQYSLSKKAETKTADKDAKAAEVKEAEKPSATPPADSGKKASAEPAKEVKNVGAAEPAKPGAAAEKPNLPEGFDFLGTGDKVVPGHRIEGVDPKIQIPAIIHSCWRGAATDNRYISLAHLQSGSTFESGKRPEPLSKPFTVDELRTEDVNILFSIVGYRSAIIQIGIQFMYLDDKGTFSTFPNSANYLKVKKGSKEMYLIKYHEKEPLTQQVYGGGDKQVFIDFVELPHDHEIDKAVGTHYVSFRIAEIIPGQSDYVVEDGIVQPRKIEWLWESNPFEFTIAEKKV